MKNTFVQSMRGFSKGLILENLLIFLSYMHLVLGNMDNVKNILSWNHGPPIFKKKRERNRGKLCNLTMFWFSVNILKWNFVFVLVRVIWRVCEIRDLIEYTNLSSRALIWNYTVQVLAIILYRKDTRTGSKYFITNITLYNTWDTGDLWTCVCGAQVKNQAANRYQHRKRCDQYQIHVTLKAKIEPKAKLVGKNKSYYVTFIWF